MRNQSLRLWLKENSSVSPKNFYRNSKPDLELGAFISLDVATDLHLVNTIDTGNLYDSWHKNKDYIEKACYFTGVSDDNEYDQDNEEKRMILNKLGEPPLCCYNLYFITVYNAEEEKLVYIGKTDSRKSRFSNGHLAALKLHDPKYNKYCKRVYFGTLMYLSEDGEYIPLEFITPFNVAKKYLSEMEAFLIDWFNPELNKKSESIGNMKYASIVHIQNFSQVSSFLHDYFVYGK